MTRRDYVLLVLFVLPGFVPTAVDLMGRDNWLTWPVMAIAALLYFAAVVFTIDGLQEK